MVSCKHPNPRRFHTKSIESSRDNKTISLNIDSVEQPIYQVRIKTDLHEKGLHKCGPGQVLMPVTAYYLHVNKSDA